MKKSEIKKKLLELVQSKVDGTVEIQERNTDNDTKVTYIVVRIGNNPIGMAIHVEDKIEDIIKGKIDIDWVADGIVAAVEQNRGSEKNVDISIVEHWHIAREYIRRRLISNDKNRELLDDLVSIPFLDLSIVFFIEIPLKDGSVGKVNVTKTILEQWKKEAGIAVDDIVEAVENNEKGYYVALGLMDLLQKSGLDDEDYNGVEDPFKLTVLTSEQRAYGNGAILNNELLESVAERLGGKIALLPSSLHEWIAMTYCDNEQYMKDVIDRVNADCVGEKDIFSDHPYFYDTVTKSVTY